MPENRAHNTSVVMSLAGINLHPCRQVRVARTSRGGSPTTASDAARNAVLHDPIMPPPPAAAEPWDPVDDAGSRAMLPMPLAARSTAMAKRC